MSDLFNKTKITEIQENLTNTAADLVNTGMSEVQEVKANIEEQAQAKIDDISAKVDGSSINSAVKLLMGVILDMLTPEVCKSFIESILDRLEEAIQKTENKIDDVVVGAIINKIRKLIGIEPEALKTNDAVEKQLAEDQVDNLTDAITHTIDLASFDSAATTKLFENVSDIVTNARKNPFEK